MKNEKIAFIGAGNMAGALIGGMLAEGVSPDRIWATDLDEVKLNTLAAHCKINVTTDKATAIKAADVVVLSVKPQVMSQVCHEIADVMREHKPLIISVAAGIQAAHLNRWLGDHLAIIRAMPNTPALIRAGATGLFANQHASESHRELAENILRTAGLVLWVDNEAQMDYVTALSGSGPAYIFRIMEAMEQAGEALGLPHNVARLLTLQTTLGAATLAMESSDDLKTLRERVTSPGGTTEQGLKQMNEMNIDKLFEQTLKAASQRSQELAKQFGESE
ncbi:MAG: pyrroline-5-carboxylate reductase [Gammaproteobacteria bacterium]|nr:pyrroline-5-carboxylate reductase [Gammaproteobacteria bacterium]